ncbi:hypothetical protein SHKM778_70060 [Streptomyces sp. KM77-8]|uniref:Uncharacterized protein n=1 Tax=Streptomyces haneummycinicus TaxID=3074435 RepID=A0AAT9HTZ3_9ACTN
MDDDGVPGGGLLQLAGASADQRVDDRVEDGQPLRVGEDDGPQPGPVQAAVGGENLRAEGVHDGREARRARFHDLARDPVGVDQHGPALDEQP